MYVGMFVYVYTDVYTDVSSNDMHVCTCISPLGSSLPDDPCPKPCALQRSLLEPPHTPKTVGSYSGLQYMPASWNSTRHYTSMLQLSRGPTLCVCTVHDKSKVISCDMIY